MPELGRLETTLPLGLRRIARTLVDLSSTERRRMRAIAMGMSASFDLAAVRRSMSPDTLTVREFNSTKFLDYERFLRINARRAVALGLDHGPPRRILDLGCGPGYFLAIARAMGHDALGLDLGDNQVFNALITSMRLRRVELQISPCTPLPNLGEFDLITGFRICFDRFPLPWSEADWVFFLKDALGRLTPSGGIHLLLNQHSSIFTPGLLREKVLTGFRVLNTVTVVDSPQVIELRRRA